MVETSRIKNSSSLEIMAKDNEIKTPPQDNKETPPQDKDEDLIPAFVHFIIAHGRLKRNQKY